jgi:hypothetical protein
MIAPVQHNNTSNFWRKVGYDWVKCIVTLIKMRIYRTLRPYFEISDIPKLSAQNNVQNMYTRYIAIRRNVRPKKKDLRFTFFMKSTITKGNATAR